MYNLLYLVPKNWLSRVVGTVMERRWPFGLHGFIRDRMIGAFKPDIGEAEHPLERYHTWSEFFTRRLRPGARPLGASPLVSPVDGKLTQRGRLEARGAGPELLLTQVKGMRYTLSGLLGGWETGPYAGGAFLTVYLAPFNYHRIHAPADVRVLRARHVAGALWPVNTWSVASVRDLFVRNDRVLVEMEGLGENPGRMAIALVGATNVGRTTLAFCDLRGNLPSNARAKDGVRDFVPKEEVVLRKGDDLGCFEMGSTIVLVLDARWAARVRAGLLDADGGALTVRLGDDWGVSGS
jgi:phosphatidylserine decarboxylase